MATTSSTFTEAWLDGPDGHHFYTRTYAAIASPTSKAVLLFVHGFADHISRYGTIHPRFAQRGITVFAYDMRGFGRTALDEERRSPDEAYGKTDRSVELSDLEWWVRHVRRTYPTAPIFVMGHSAGGGMTLAFAIRTPSKEALPMVSGIIAQCPLVRLTHPTPWVLTWVAYMLSKTAPALPFPATMPEERFSRDPAEVAALKQDPLRKAQGTVRGLYEMVAQGEELVERDYKQWPVDLPLLMTWGTADEVNCPKAGVAFFNKLDALDKELVEYDGALHDLLHEAGDIPDKVIERYVSWIDAHVHEPPRH